MKEQLYIRLKALRQKNKLSQNEVADYLQISRQSISQWETGKAYPDIDNLIRLSDLYGISIDELVRESNNDYHVDEKDKLCQAILEMKLKNQEVKDDAIKIHRSTIEMICLAILLVLSSQFAIIGMVVSIVVFVWMKCRKKDYKIIYMVCIICLIVSGYNTCVLISHMGMLWNNFQIKKI